MPSSVACEVGLGGLRTIRWVPRVPIQSSPLPAALPAGPPEERSSAATAASSWRARPRARRAGGGTPRGSRTIAR
eukprot:3493250-Pyramimonas_sp.AAC.1